MFRKSTALALALTLGSIPAIAMAHDVSSGPVVAAGSTVLSLTAEGRSNKVPDLAVFSAGVTSQGKTAGEALSANAADMNRVIAALKRSGIADRDIQTSNLNLNPVYSQPRLLANGQYDNEPQRIVGYQVNNTVTVRQRKLDQFGKVIDTLVTAGANQVNGPSFQMDNADAALDEARIDAMKKARDRANLYARAAGLKVARILTISESGGYAPQPPIMYARAEKSDAAASTPIAAGEVSMNASVTVTFELTP